MRRIPTTIDAQIDWLIEHIPEYGTENECACYQYVGREPVICPYHIEIYETKANKESATNNT